MSELAYDSEGFEFSMAERVRTQVSGNMINGNGAFISVEKTIIILISSRVYKRKTVPTARILTFNIVGCVYECA